MARGGREDSLSGKENGEPQRPMEKFDSEDLGY